MSWFSHASCLHQAQSDAPWEARTPDLEVNSLTLWPAELRKLVQHAERSWFSAKASPSPDVLVLAWQLPSHSLRSDAPWEARTPDLEVNSLTLWPAELRKLCSLGA